MTRVFAQAAFFDPERDALAWALEIATWECRTARQQQTRARLEPLSAAASTAGSGDPQAMLQQAELEQALQGALGALSPSDRAEISRLLAEEMAGDAAARKRRQRALHRLKLLWRRIHGAS